MGYKGVRPLSEPLWLPPRCHNITYCLPEPHDISLSGRGGRFFGIMEVVVVNSYILYSQNTGSHRKFPHMEFRREVVMSLCAPLYNAAPTRERVQLYISMEHLRRWHFIDGGGLRRDCRVCSKRGVPGKRHLTL